MLIPVRLIDGLSSERNRPGDVFTATLEKELVAGEFVIAERGARVEGRVIDARMTILPLPSVSVSGIKFGNAPGGSAPNMAEIESATVKVALIPLLSHKAEITSIVLAHPTIVLEKLKDGTGNWQLTPVGGATNGGTTPTPSGRAATYRSQAWSNPPAPANTNGNATISPIATIDN